MAFLAAAAPYLMAASAGISAVSGFMQGQAASKNASYQAQIAANNATIANNNARLASETGAQQVQNQQLQTRKIVGDIVTQEGANNLNINSGSNLAVQESAGRLGELDANTIQQQAENTAWNYKSQAAQDTAESKLLKTESEQSNIASFIGAGASLVGGAASIGNQQLLSQMYSGGANATHSTLELADTNINPY